VALIALPLGLASLGGCSHEDSTLLINYRNDDVTVTFAPADQVHMKPRSFTSGERHYLGGAPYFTYQGQSDHVVHRITISTSEKRGVTLQDGTIILEIR
jgi:hypothetical protein